MKKIILLVIVLIGMSIGGCSFDFFQGRESNQNIDENKINENKKQEMDISETKKDLDETKNLNTEFEDEKSVDEEDDKTTEDDEEDTEDDEEDNEDDEDESDEDDENSNSNQTGQNLINNAKNNTYLDYKSDKLLLNIREKINTILFFYYSGDRNSSLFENNIKGNLKYIPNDIRILKVDLINEVSLFQKYNVGSGGLVFIDKEGKTIKTTTTSEYKNNLIETLNDLLSLTSSGSLILINTGTSLINTGVINNTGTTVNSNGLSISKVENLNINGQIPGLYSNYSLEKLQNSVTNNKIIVLFFYGTGNSISKSLDENILKNINLIPYFSDILKVDYNVKLDLVEKYNVLSGGTLVYLDSTGKIISSTNGHLTLGDIVIELKKIKNIK